MDQQYTLIFPFIVSLVIGALIGLEREKKKIEEKNMSAIGIRTSILICLFGTLSAYLSKTYDPLIFLFGLSALLILILSSHIILVIKYKRIGLTTEISSILLFLYGAMCAFGQIQLAVILAIITALILSTRVYLHNIVNNISTRELFDTIKFAIIAFIILPFLPNISYDQQLLGSILPGAPLMEGFSDIDVLNPYRIWLLVVFVSGISFTGYILIKLFGKKVGISLTGLMGGLYSSTATSLTLANKSKEIPGTINPFVSGIVLACAISFIKTFIFIGALNEELFLKTLTPLTLMFVYLLILGLVFFFKSNKVTGNSVKKGFKSPFSLINTIKLGSFIVAALLIAKISLMYAGVELYYIIATLSAFFAIDDPIVISTSAIAGNLMSYFDAKNIIILVTYLNMIQKVAIVYFFGNRKLVKPLALIFGGLFLVTLIGFVYL